MRQRARRSAERAQDANASPGSEHPDSVAVIREAMSICSPRRFVKQKSAATWGLGAQRSLGWTRGGTRSCYCALQRAIIPHQTPHRTSGGIARLIASLFFWRETTRREGTKSLSHASPGA